MIIGNNCENKRFGKWEQTTTLHVILKKRLIDIVIHGWSADIQNNRYLNTYAHLKDTFEIKKKHI